MLLAGALDFGALQAGLDDADHLVGDLVLHTNTLSSAPSNRSAQICAPVSASRTKFLRGDAQPIGRFAHAAFQDIAHAEIAPDLPDVDGFALVDENRMAGYYEQPFDARQTCDAAPTMPSTKYSCSASPLMWHCQGKSV